jgi:SAM-dependent methyltransferase
MHWHGQSRHLVLEKYTRLAADYDTRWSFYIEATTRETIARLALRPTDRLVDIGCGTGVLLDQLARSHPPAQLIGVDAVPEMLAIARRLPEAVEQNAHPSRLSSSMSSHRATCFTTFGSPWKRCARWAAFCAQAAASSLPTGAMTMWLVVSVTSIFGCSAIHTLRSMASGIARVS